MNNPYVATITLFFPSTLQNLPFYNTTLTVSGSSIGSSFASDIARELFRDFKELYNQDQLKLFLSSLTAQDLFKDMKFEMLDQSADSKQIKEGSKEVAISAINHLLDLMRREINT